jgi:hypothetical protein
MFKVMSLYVDEGAGAMISLLSRIRGTWGAVRQADDSGDDAVRSGIACDACRMRGATPMGGHRQAASAVSDAMVELTGQLSGNGKRSGQLSG